MAQDHALRVWRKEKGVTLAALASVVGVSPSHLSEVERGLNNPSLELAAKLSEATESAVMIGSFVRQPQAAE